MAEYINFDAPAEPDLFDLAPEFDPPQVTATEKPKKSPVKRPHSLKRKFVTSVVAAALVAATAFGAKEYFNEQGRLHSVKDYQSAIEGLDAGELNHGLRDLLHGKLSSFADEAGKKPEGQSLNGMFDKQAYVQIRDDIVNEWIKEADANHFPGTTSDDVKRQQSALRVLTGWKAGADEQLVRQSFNALVDVMVAKVANTAYDAVNSDEMTGGLKTVFAAALENLNAARQKLNPSLTPLSEQDFHHNSTALLASAPVSRSVAGDAIGL